MRGWLQRVAWASLAAVGWAHFLSFRLTPRSPSREAIALHWEERTKSRSEITDWGAHMKKPFLLAAVVFSGAYVVRTAGTDYHIRQVKPSDKALIPINTPIEFTLDKDKIRFKANGKSYEYLVVSEAAAATTADAIKP